MSSQRSGSVLLAVVIGGGALLASYRCPFHAVTGWYCPGCGGTRALFALLHGEPALAWRDNALALTAFPGALAFAWFAPESWQRAAARHQTLIAIAAAVLTLGFTLARNTVAPGLAPSF